MTSTVIVCVLLLSGLLASMWEFPSVELSADCTQKHRKEEEDKYLKNKLGVIVQKVNQRTSLGDVSTVKETV